ncbi:proline iminopeptidase [Sanghuangporus baumii]|uniref:Proline iminopeptidase n=1 Tax=Sanghuangporus baumii TaxID=108892 RepID=A0A9Q5I090_SANBA|nr:proline iminopeptidase [Sanghuangporus baumii]
MPLTGSHPVSVPLVSEGTIPFIVGGETYSTWYKLFGSLESTTRPLVVLHGGPGASHDYMLPLADLAQSDRPVTVILYDQLGTARSKHPDLLKKDPSFWTIELFISELENLLTFFYISHSFDLIGHSWGATLAAEFIVSRQPAGLRRLILSNSLASAKLRNQSIEQLRKTLPDEIQEALRKHEAAKTTDAPEYKNGQKVFFENFGCRLKSPPTEVIYSLSRAELEGGKVQRGIRDSGMANDWSIIDRIHEIRVPTLLINGKYDFMSDEVCMPFFLGLEKVKWVHFYASSHVPHWEERERYVSTVREFLQISMLVSRGQRDPMYDVIN